MILVSLILILKSMTYSKRFLKFYLYYNLAPSTHIFQETNWIPCLFCTKFFKGEHGLAIHERKCEEKKKNGILRLLSIIFYLELLISCNHSLINANIHYPLIMIWNILHKVLSSRHANILLFYFISWPSILVELPPSEMCSLAGYLCPDGWCCWPKPTSTLIMRSSS